MFAKLNNGVLQYAPNSFKTNDGYIITNFNKNISLMREFGFKELIDVKPSYNLNSQYIYVEGYTETSDAITINYIIKDIESASPLYERIEQLEKVNSYQDELINISLLATDEMYMMIEPLLSSVNIIDAKEVSRMVDMYVVMIQRGLKAIEDVPLRYREEVKRILEALEK